LLEQMSTPSRETTTATSTGQMPLGQEQFQQQMPAGPQVEPAQFGQRPLEGQGPMGQPLQKGPDELNINLPSGQNVRAQLPLGGPAAIPGARVKEWTVVENLPTDLPPAPPGFRVVQYERDIEVDLANLNLAPAALAMDVCTPVSLPVCAPCEPCKPEIHVETTTVPPTQLNTTTKEFPGGEEVTSTGPHGEKIKTKVTHLPGGGERIETKVKEPLGAIKSPEDIKTRTTVKECDFGGTTVVESESKIVPPAPFPVETGHHHHGHEEGATRKGKIGHHHHDTSLGGLLRGAFGLKHGEHTPKETM